MKAYILEEKGKAGFKDIPLPEIKPYDALVRTTAVSTCTTDIHLIKTALDKMNISGAYDGTTIIRPG